MATTPPPQQGVVEPVLDQGGDSLRRTIDPEEPESKYFPGGNGHASRPDLKQKEDHVPRPPQPHMVPICAFVDAVGTDTLPPGFKLGAFSALSKDMYKDGVTGEESTQAGNLIRTWLNASQLRIRMEWTVAEITRYLRLSIALVRQSVTPFDIERFMTETYRDPFWNKKVINLKYLADHITPNQNISNPDQDMIDDPDRPGIRMTRQQYDHREAQRRAYEQSQQ